MIRMVGSITRTRDSDDSSGAVHAPAEQLFVLDEQCPNNKDRLRCRYRHD